MKKRLSLILVLVMFIVSVTACTKTPTTPASSTGGSSAASSSAAGEIPTVLFTPWAGGAEAYAAMQTAFAKKNTDVKLVITEQSSYHEWLAAQASANNLPDIFYLTNYSLVWNFAKAGYLMDLTGKPYLAKTFKSTLYGVTLNNKVYAAPWALSAGNAVIYNVDHFKTAGIDKVPTTLTELEAACAKLKAAKFTPFAGAFLDAWTVGQAYMPCISAQVDDPFALTAALNDKSKTFTKNVDIASITRFLNILKNNSQANALDTDDAGAVKLLGEGKASMYINGDWTFASVLKVNPKFNFDVFAPPADDNAAHAKLAVDTGLVLGVNAKTKNTAAVDKVMTWLMDGTDSSDAACGPIVAKYLGIPAFESVNQPAYGAASKSISKYITTGMTTPWFFSLAPQGFKQVSESEAVGYLNGTYTSEQFWKIMDKDWADLVK